MTMRLWKRSVAGISVALSTGGHSVEGTLNNAKGEQSANAYAARLSGGRLRALRPAEAAARSQRKSPEKAICSQPTGDVWASRSSGTATDVDRRCWAAASMRSEERRVGKEGVSTCRSRWSPDH